MKLTCDLCGGQLMVGSGGQSASCTVCGLLYSMERLREKLSIIADPFAELPATPAPVKNTIKVKLVKKNSVAPVIEPPVIEPPVIEPPVIEPPVIEPPVIEPPVIEPPVIEPPVIEPPVIEPPVIEPPVIEPPVIEPPVIEPPVIEPPVIEPPVIEPPVIEPPVEEPPVIEPPVQLPPMPKIPASYWIPPMDPPIAPLFAMELKSISFSTIRGIVLSGTVARGSQLLVGTAVCSVISCRPSQPSPGNYAEVTISNCPARNVLRNISTILGYSPTLAELEANALIYPGSPKAYMTRVLQTAFSDCQIQVTNAPAPTDPVLFTFHQYGQKKLVVILCHGNRYESKPVLDIMDQCREQRIPSLRFFENFWNNREYIIGRIRKALNG